MAQGIREVITRYVVTGALDALRVEAVEAVVVEGGWLVKIESCRCRVFVPTRDAGKLSADRAAAELRLQTILNHGGHLGTDKLC